MPAKYKVFVTDGVSPSGVDVLKACPQIEVIESPTLKEKELLEKSLVALPLGRRKMKRNWGVIHWRGRRLSLAEETFLGLCKAATADLGKTSLSDAASS